MRHKNFDELASEIVSNGGCTLQTVTWTTPESGYAVSLKNHGVIIPLSEFDGDSIREYLRQEGYSIAFLLRRPNHYFGAWLDGESVHLDVSVVETDLVKALWLAVHNGQRAIYDLSSGRVLETVLESARLYQRMRETLTRPNALPYLTLYRTAIGRLGIESPAAHSSPVLRVVK